MATSYEIHPTIGIARIGNSNGFFIGPEPGQPAPASYRDNAGILRQAARFRIFRVERDATGAIQNAAEIKPEEADIEWTVHLANRKATAVKLTKPAERRNKATGHDAADAALIIDGGAKKVSQASPKVSFDHGAFRGKPVFLGEASLEAATGRLLVAGGKGKSGFVLPLAPGDTPDKTPPTFADNDGWYDDTSEGPVTASIHIKATGERPKVTAARVIVGPPDFAPGIDNFLTLYDIYYQVGLDKGLFAKPADLSFMRFVFPILKRASGYQWVNGAGFEGHGGEAIRNFDKLMAAYSSPDKPAQPRRTVFTHLRNPAVPSDPQRAMPRLFSEEGYLENVHKVLTLTAIQYEAFTRWSATAPAGFVWDFPTDPFAGQSLPDALDRVALEACAGGAFFPGIEAPRFLREGQNYEPTLPLRLKEDTPAGMVNAASAVPWQADFLDCTWEGQRDPDGIETGIDGYGWWPAQRPDSAFTDATLNTRQPWIGDIQTAAQMVDRWHTRKFVLAVKNAAGETVYALEP